MRQTRIRAQNNQKHADNQPPNPNFLSISAAFDASLPLGLLLPYVIVTAGPAGANGFSGMSWVQGGGFPLYTDPGPMPPPTRGANFFYGGNNCPLSSAHQTMTGADRKSTRLNSSH